MASYVELKDLIFEPGPDQQTVRDNTVMAIVVAANAFLQGASTTPEKAWAVRVIYDTTSLLDALNMVWPLVLAAAQDANPGITVAQINAASSATVQGYVDAVASAVAAGTA